MQHILQNSKPSEFDPRLHSYNTSLLLGSEAGYEIPVIYAYSLASSFSLWGSLHLGGLLRCFHSYISYVCF